MILALLIIATHPVHLTDRQAGRIAYRKCGPEGTVDWDDNPRFPPPHCNRKGWNGRRYRSK